MRSRLLDPFLAFLRVCLSGVKHGTSRAFSSLCTRSSWPGSTARAYQRQSCIRTLPPQFGIDLIGQGAQRGAGPFEKRNTFLAHLAMAIGVQSELIDDKLTQMKPPRRAIASVTAQRIEMHIKGQWIVDRRAIEPIAVAPCRGHGEIRRHVAEGIFQGFLRGLGDSLVQFAKAKLPFGEIEGVLMRNGLAIDAHILRYSLVGRAWLATA